MSKKKLNKLTKKLLKLKRKKSEITKKENGLKEEALEVMEEMGINKIYLDDCKLEKKYGKPSFKTTVQGGKVSQSKQELLDEIMKEGRTEYFSIAIEQPKLYNDFQKSHPLAVGLLNKHNLKLEVKESLSIS